ncbi:MAG: L,D-transpeptidase [Acidimicrobiia bacterium]
MDENKGGQVAAIVAVVFVLVVGFFVFRSGGSGSAAGTAPPPAPVGQFLAGMANTGVVALYDSPAAPAPSLILDNPTFEGLPLVLMVLAQGPEGWLQVQYNQRPNGATAWLHGADLNLVPVPNRVVIAVGGRLLTVYRGTSEEVLMQAPVAVGTDATPTPLGGFYVDAALPVEEPGNAYGQFILSVAGFSDVLTSFGGSPGQIAIHGTYNPAEVGQAVSNGCLRLTNENILLLASMAPPGTPVNIVA